MKFPHSAGVSGYPEVTVNWGAGFTVSLTVEGVELCMYTDESKALRKALKAAEKTSRYANREDASV